MADEIHKSQVLVVDDEQLNRDLLHRVLAVDYEIQEAEDAFEAMKLLESEGSVDVLICDQMMPGKSGTDLAREISKKWPNIVSVLLTGYADSTEVLEALREGIVFEVVGKPMLVGEFREVIVRAVSEFNRRRST